MWYYLMSKRTMVILFPSHPRFKHVCDPLVHISTHLHLFHGSSDTSQYIRWLHLILNKRSFFWLQLTLRIIAYSGKSLWWTCLHMHIAVLSSWLFETCRFLCSCTDFFHIIFYNFILLVVVPTVITITTPSAFRKPLLYYLPSCFPLSL